MNFEQRVYDIEFKLNDTDDSVIEYIRNNRSNINKISIQKIANELYISPNAIMRLARKLGYSGFSELKYALKNEGLPLQIKTVTSQLFDNIPNNIARTLDINDGNDIKSLAQKMDKAKKILFVGVGDSLYFCELFGRYLRCMGKQVEYFAQIHDSEYTALNYGENDMIFIISASGNTQRLIDLAKKSKKQKTYLVCLTHYGDNSLSSICNEQICFWGERRTVNNYNVTDYIGLMMIIRMICEEFWNKFTDKDLALIK